MAAAPYENGRIVTEYHTVFQISRTGGGMAEFFVVPLLFLLVGVGLVRGWIQFQNKHSKVAGYFFICFSVFIEILVIWNAFKVQGSLTDALTTGRYHVVEGFVQNFEPMNDWKNKHESFTVHGVRFTYSDFIVDQCFNNSSTHGGPIRAGLLVRVSYVGDCILRLEVAQDRPH